MTCTWLIRQLPADFAEAVKHCQCRVHQARVKLAAAPLADVRMDIFLCPGFFISAFGTECIDHVNDRHYTALQRNCLSGQTLRITAAVPMFMVAVGNARATMNIG